MKYKVNVLACIVYVFGLMNLNLVSDPHLLIYEFNAVVQQLSVTIGRCLLSPDSPVRKPRDLR